MMSDILVIKIETCLQLCEGNSNLSRARDFKRKVMKVTGLTQSGFEEHPHCKIAYNKLENFHEIKDILNELF